MREPVLIGNRVSFFLTGRRALAVVRLPLSVLGNDHDTINMQLDERQRAAVLRIDADVADDTWLVAHDLRPADQRVERHLLRR